MVQGKINRGIHIVRLGTTPSRLISTHLHQMLFFTPCSIIQIQNGRLNHFQFRFRPREDFLVLGVFRSTFCMIVTTSGAPILLKVGNRTPQIKRRSTLYYTVQRFCVPALFFVHFHNNLHFPCTKWQLQLLPVLTS